ncbi:MAG: hypothetical protein ACW98X_27045 [Promethearchaeota archaeon]|jgi:hypothetical protein
MTRIKPLSYIITILIIAISVASESYAQGFDPLVENPANSISTGQQLNYPKIWHLLFLTGMDQSHTNLAGSIVVFTLFIGLGLFWFLNKFDNLTYIILSLAVLSSAVMLGIERANIELVLFFIISSALVVNYSSSTKALFLFLFASVLKLYPIFGLFYLLKENKKKFWVLFLSAISIFIIYLLFTFADSMRVYATTPKLAGSSFGMNVWWMGLIHRRFFDIHMADSVVLFLRTLSYVMVFLISAGTLFFSLRNNDKDRFRQGEYLDAFRVGAGIYIGCFIVITNSDHRLLFLIFTIPQLVSWFHNRGRGFSLVPLITLSAMIFSLWSTFIMRILGRKMTFVLEEFSNWIVLACLLYLFLASVPDWFSNYLRWPFSRIKLFNIQPIPTDE